MNKKIVGIVFSGILCIGTVVGLRHKYAGPPYTMHAIKDKKNVVHIAVIGGGVAGLSAAIYGARAGFHAVYFEDDAKESQLDQVSSLANWPGVPPKSGHEILESLRNQAELFGAQRSMLAVKDLNLSQWPFELTLSDGTIVHALSIIVATGAFPKTLGVPGEQHYMSKGVAVCTKCDAPLTKNEKVVIVGSNDPAIEYAIHISPYTHDITIMLKEDKLQATPYKQRSFEDHPWINVAYRKEVVEVLGDGSGVTGLKVRDLDHHTTEIVPAKWLFLAVGSKPNSDLFVQKLSLGSSGHIVTKIGTQETSIEGVFAAGTVADTRYKQASVASGDGARAGLDASNFLFDIDERIIAATKEHLYKPAQSEQLDTQK